MAAAARAKNGGGVKLPDSPEVGALEDPTSPNGARIGRNGKTLEASIKDILVYILFLCLYTWYSIRYLSDPDFYYFGANIKDQLVGNELNEDHSPTFAKTFNDLSSVEEVYQWLQGPMVTTVFSPNTFDGDSNWKFQDGRRLGYTLGYQKFLGSVRISQLRSQRHDCKDRVPKVLYDPNQTYWCYGSKSSTGSFGAFDKATEETSAFGRFKSYKNTSAPARPFVYDGVDMSGAPTVVTDDPVVKRQTHTPSVKLMRSRLGSSFQTKKGQTTYPASAYGITLNPTAGVDAAETAMVELQAARYIDLHTRIVFIDLTVYNAMLDHIAWIRLSMEISRSGGVMPSDEVEVMRMWDNVYPEDSTYGALQACVSLFYAYFLLRELKKWRKQRRKYWKGTLNVVQLVNIIFFIVAEGCKSYASLLYPSTIDINSEIFVDFLPGVSFKKLQVAIAATNVFLNWFKVIGILSFAPAFGMMSTTLSLAAAATTSFMIIFFIVFYGFAQAHAMIFGSRIENFRTVREVPTFSILHAHFRTMPTRCPCTLHAKLPHRARGTAVSVHGAVETMQGIMPCMMQCV
jgi:hypothetical protein